MSRKLILILLLLLAGSTALGQGTPAPPPKPDQGQKKPDPDPTLGTVTSGGLNQNVVSASDLSNDELLARSRSIYVVSDTIFVKKEDMDKYLLRQKELEEFRLHVVQTKQDADLILHIKRIPFTNNFPYSITDRVSSIVLMQGEIDALPSKVPPQIASALADKLKEANKKKQ
ncbi:MAG TPA: hypothetical protein VI685_12010 [Candidatus Angelobacter sp.]